MPLYNVHYITPLTDRQQDALAEAITASHTTTFNAPRLFVNVIFTPVTTNRYVAGKRKNTNLIVAEVRHGPSRTDELYQKVIKQVREAWERIVGTTGDQELRAVLVMGSIVAGVEVGFPIPPAGHDLEWLRKYYPQFQKLADSGDEDFQGLVQELKTREEFKGIVDAGEK